MPVTVGKGGVQSVVPIRDGRGVRTEPARQGRLRVFLMGKRVEEPVDHPMIRPSINAVAETYDLAVREEELASADSSISGRRVNRFLHIAESAEDLVLQNKMQRKLGQLTGTCFQRCVGMDALNSLHSTTHEIDTAARHKVPRAPPQVHHDGPGGKPRHWRGDD